MNSQPDDDATSELLRQALADEAACVQPDPQALHAIQQRTSADSSHSSGQARKFSVGSSRTNVLGGRQWVLGALGAGVATAAVIAAVVVVGDRGGNPSGTPAAGGGHATSSSSLSPSPSTSTGPSDATASAPPTPASTMHRGVYDTNAPAADQVTMYYVSAVSAIDATKNTARIYPELHTITPGSGSPAVAAVHEFLTSTPMDHDYSSGWPAGVDVTGITTSNGVTTIALTGTADPGTRPVSVPPNSDRPDAIQALLATAGVEGRANFTYNGKPVERILYTPASVTRQPDDEVRAWVSITSPVEGQTVDNPVTITGSANVFEANVNWELLDDNGKVVDSGNAMAGFMEWKPFSIDLGKLGAGTYTIRAFEASAKDGRPTYVDDKTFTVR